MPKENKFSFLQAIPEERGLENPLNNQSSETEKVALIPMPPQEEPPLVNHEALVGESHAMKKMGRPKGKRSDPNYEQVTAYIRKDTHLQVKITLLQEGQGREFSELLEELLTEFLSTQKLK
jgi:hypothetical protein